MEPMFQQLGIAVLLGLLVGLQREHAANGVAGMRTFPLITVLGSLSAMLSTRLGGSWVIAAGLLAVVAVTIVGHLLRFQERERDQSSASNAHLGVTTDVAMLLMFAVGAFVVVGPMAVAVAVGGGVAVLLQFKPELHSIAQKLGDADLRAIMQFVLITCIILPVLPNQTYDPLAWYPHHVPLKVINPREIWLMVVLIVGLSLGGYISYKFFGRDAGTLLGGILGGAVSSTATTVSYARSATRDAIGAQTAAIVILIASTVMYVRLLVAVAVVSQDFLQTVLLPVVVLMVLTLLPAVVLWYHVRRVGKGDRHLLCEAPEGPFRQKVPVPFSDTSGGSMPDQQNPTQLRSAVVFGVMYAAVLVALAAAQFYWNGRGLYVVAFLSGLTEMDAITLSTARLSATDTTVAADGWRMIVVAAIANLVSKTAIAGLLGGWRLLVRLAILFAIPMLGGAALLVLR
jgi:uncharacterized membrane protein (DUF4010 family)